MPTYDDDDGPPYRPLAQASSSASAVSLLEPARKTSARAEEADVFNGGSITHNKMWLSLTEAAAYLGVSKKTVQRSPIPRSKVGRLPRFSRQAIDEYLVQRQETPPDTQIIPAVRTSGISLSRRMNNGASRATLSKADRATHLLKLLED